MLRGSYQLEVDVADETKIPPSGPAPAKPETPPKTEVGASGAKPTQLPAESPIKKRRKELEEELKGYQEEGTRQSQRARAITATMLAELKDLEARQGKSGFHELTPIGNLLVVDGSVLEQYPDDHLRWVNETVPGRPAFLKSIGYERVPGQIAGGDTVLWKVPREHWAKRTVTKVEKTDADLRKATSANREEQASRLQEYFEKQGVEVDVRRLLIGG